MGTLGQFCVSLHRASGYLDPQGLWHYYQKWKKCGIFGTWLYSAWHFFEGQNCSLGRWFGLSGRVVKNRTVFFGGIWNDCLIFLVRERGREREDDSSLDVASNRFTTKKIVFAVLSKITTQYYLSVSSLFRFVCESTSSFYLLLFKICFLSHYIFTKKSISFFLINNMMCSIFLF